MITRFRAMVCALTPLQQSVCVAWLIFIGPLTVGALIWVFKRWNRRQALSQGVTK